jgi:two-component system, chemotaxis family, chemotaxis protein CheY
VSDYDLSNLRILIVSDHQPMHHILRGILREWGINNVGDASNGQEALDTLRNFDADVLISGYKVSPIDGLELTKTIRSGEAGVDPHLPIILITAYTEIGIIFQARDAGVNEFLAKPITAKLVYSRIQSIIEHPRPFVRTEEYFGPDRRRHNMTLVGSDRRTAQQKATGSERQTDRE